MPRPPRIPTYSLHKNSGQARVRIDGQDHYLGLHGSPESRHEYARLIAERYRPGGGEHLPVFKEDGYPQLALNELFVRYLTYATTYYQKDGVPTSEVENMKDSMKPARTLYGLTPARDFGPLALKAVRQFMLDQKNLCRRVINARINRLRRIFRWAVGEELIPPSVLEGLKAVEGLRQGRCTAYEPEPIRPVADAWIKETLPFLRPQLADMVRLQCLTGMRPGNLVTLRWIDVDQTGKVWLYHDWLRVGCAIHHELPDEEGLALWDDVAKRSKKYSVGACEIKWASFTSNTTNPVTVGTLINWIREDDPDYRPPPRPALPAKNAGNVAKHKKNPDACQFAVEFLYETNNLANLWGKGEFALRYFRGDFWRWDGRVWRRLDNEALTANITGYLQRRQAKGIGRGLVAAGKKNGRLRRPWTTEDRVWQQENALRHQPWRFSTGPRTWEGKRIAANNGRRNKPKPGSKRQLRAELAEVNSFTAGLTAFREGLLGR